MSICARIFISISFHHVDAAPHTEAGTQGNHQRLKGCYCGLKKCHIVFAGTGSFQARREAAGFAPATPFQELRHPLRGLCLVSRCRLSLKSQKRSRSCAFRGGYYAKTLDCRKNRREISRMVSQVARYGTRNSASARSSTANSSGSRMSFNTMRPIRHLLFFSPAYRKIAIQARIQTMPTPRCGS